MRGARAPPAHGQRRAGVVYGIGALVAEKDAGSAGCGDAELEYVALPTLHTRLAGPVRMPTQAWKPGSASTLTTT